MKDRKKKGRKKPSKKETDVQTDVKSYLSEKGYARTDQLVNDLLELHPGKYCEGTIYSAIRKMSIGNSPIIKKSSYDEISEFFLLDGKKDGRSSYLSLQDPLEDLREVKTYIDESMNVFKADANKKQLDNIEKIEVLVDIYDYKKMFVLTSDQLDILVAELDSDDDQLIFHLLLVFYDHVVGKKVKPSGKKKFVEALKALLQRYPVDPKGQKKRRGFILSLLGEYNDYAVVEQLLNDASSLNDPASVQDQYMNESTCKVIEKNRKVIRDALVNLKREGNTKGFTFLSEIRTRARVLGGWIEKDDFQELTDKMGGNK